MLLHIIEKAGDRAVGKVDREQIELNMKEKTLHMANLMLNTLRTMYAWAVEAKLIEENPAAAIPYLKEVRTDPDAELGHKTWTEADLAQYEATYPVGTLERHVYDWFLNSGLRVGDMSRLGSQHVDKKTGRSRSGPKRPARRYICRRCSAT